MLAAHVAMSKNVSKIKTASGPGPEPASKLASRAELRPGKRPTLADIAREAGVSPSTVSLVLNDRLLAQNLAPSTRERIRVIAGRLQYRPDAAARSLRSRRTQLVAVIVFDIADPYCTLILQGIQETLGSTGLLPIILDVHNQREQLERYLGMAVEHAVEGVIVVANWLFVELDILERFERSGICTVIVGREFPSKTISSILVDNEAGGRLALQHLLDLGHRAIAVIRGPKRLQDSQRRWRGIQQAARDAGLRLCPTLVRQLPESADPLQGFTGGYRTTREWTSTRAAFTGIVAFDDLTACGAIRALHEAGLRVPEDVSVVGFDDIPQAVLTMPSLTTVSQHMRRMGILATEHLLRLIAGDPTLPAEAFIALHPPSVVARESTAGLHPATAPL